MHVYKPIRVPVRCRGRVCGCPGNPWGTSRGAGDGNDSHHEEPATLLRECGGETLGFE